MPKLTLVIGTPSYSSWSLRPWLALKAAQAEFAEISIALRQPDTKADILRHSPSGKVPVLKYDDEVIWDSLAICEAVAELFPQAQLWPDDKLTRAIARSVAAEMHSGFQPLRQTMPMAIGTSAPMTDIPAEVQADIARIETVWTECRSRHGQHGGPFLFGRFSIADCLYAPVVTRFATYEVGLNPTARAYADAVLALPAMAEWSAKALSD